MELKHIKNKGHKASIKLPLASWEPLVVMASSAKQDKIIKAFLNALEVHYKTLDEHEIFSKNLSAAFKDLLNKYNK